MKTISLWQPWATLVAIGAKSIETRSWATSYRGPLAIHATKSTPAKALQLRWADPFRQVLSRAGVSALHAMPAGAVLATCRLVDCIQIEARHTKSVRYWAHAGRTGHECAFGDYTPGRFAWLLADVKPLAAPIPAKGGQGFWEWQPPEGVDLG